MTGHVIDSLVVELGLDPSKFDAQQTATVSRFKNNVDDLRKRGKEAEDAADKVSDAISGVKTQALEMFAAVAGGKGIIDFSTQLTHADASLGRLERNIGVSASTINRWQGVARIFGGDAKTMAQNVTSISDAFAGWKIGIVSPIIADLRAVSTAGGKIIDVNKGVEQSLFDLADNLKAIHDRDPAQAGLLGRRLGLDQALFDAMIQGGSEGLKKILDYVNKIGVASKEDTDAFGELEKRMGQMGVKAESLGRKVLGGQGGAAAKVLELADILNMTPGEAWTYLNNPNRKPLGSNLNQGQGPGSKLFPEATSASGAFGSQSDKEAFIRAEAARRGIDPDVAMRVAKTEGFNGFVSSIPGEQSYGAFQLHVTPSGRGRAVGDQFKSSTGLDPSDPANERASIMFALDDVKAHGWGAYHGAANNGIPNWAGIGATSSQTSSQHSTEINIENVNINAGANADGTKFAQDFRRELLSRQSYVAQGNIGQN